MREMKSPEPETSAFLHFFRVPPIVLLCVCVFVVVAVVAVVAAAAVVVVFNDNIVCSLYFLYIDQSSTGILRSSSEIFSIKLRVKKHRKQENPSTKNPNPI